MLDMPRYYIYYSRPVKMVRTAEGRVQVLKMNWETGDFEPGIELVDELFAAREQEIFRIDDEEEFIQELERARGRHVQGEGPVFALYETINALVETMRNERRVFTDEERALVRGLRRQTHVLFEEHLAQQRAAAGTDAET
ncbi:MAG: hypothetical protein AAGF95_28995 [Chloroflexota bacterium]